MIKPTVVLLSGGIDSTVLAEKALREGHLRALLFVAYGQPAAQMEAAAASSWHRRRAPKIPFHVAHVTLPGAGVAPLYSGVGAPGPRIVPTRNLLLCSLAVSLAVSVEACRVWYGAMGDDQERYPDCRPAFVYALNRALRESGCPVWVEIPLASHRRVSVSEIARDWGVELASTWSCYQPDHGRPCGTCDACRRRP